MGVCASSHDHVLPRWLQNRPDSTNGTGAYGIETVSRNTRDVGSEFVHR